MAKQKCTVCDGNGMVCPLDDPDACWECHGMGYYDDGCDDDEPEHVLYGMPSSKWVRMTVDERKAFIEHHDIKVHTSTFIDDMTITHGFGTLEAEGTWQYPCEWLNYNFYDRHSAVKQPCPMCGSTERYHSSTTCERNHQC